MKLSYFLPLLLLSVIGWSAKASAHGANAEYRLVQSVQIDATYAGGQPMANAQVTVYAPNDPSTVWTTGTTDEEGRFSFTPDSSQPGNWEVKVRQAGHGDIVTIPVQSASGGDGANAREAAKPIDWLGNAGKTTSSSSVQKTLSGVAGVWGFFGTALFFARRKTD